MDNKTRIRYWDIAKGIAIITFIVGHVGGVPPLVRAFIFSFHMPLFFVASAFFINEYNIKNTLVRASKNLMIPYTVVCIISAFLDASRNGDMNTNIYVLKDRILDMFVGMSKISKVCEQFHSVWLVWFVICLFLSRLIYVATMRLMQKLPWCISLVLVLGVSYVGVKMGENIGFLPWSADVSLAAIIFMWIGDHSKLVLRWVNNSRRSFIIFVVSLAIATPLWIYLICRDYWIELAARRYAGGPLCVISAILGITIVLILSIACDKKLKYLSLVWAWLGKNSMIVLAIHCLEMRFYDWNTHIYSHLPCAVSGVWYREAIIKSFFIIAASFVVVKIIECIKSERFDNKTHPEESIFQ